MILDDLSWARRANPRRVARRKLLPVMLSLSFGFTGTGSAVAQAGADRTDPANRAAYDAAMQCYVANAHAANLRRDKGDTAKAVVYEAQAKTSFDGAVRLGQAIGLSNGEMNHDLDTVEARELPKMVQDPDYFVARVANCKALGLM